MSERRMFLCRSARQCTAATWRLRLRLCCQEEEECTDGRAWCGQQHCRCVLFTVNGPNSSSTGKPCRRGNLHQRSMMAAQVLPAPCQASGGISAARCGRWTALQAHLDASVQGVAEQVADLPPGMSSNSKLGAGQLQHGQRGNTASSLRMFGAAPSPHLRQAQEDFSEALQALVVLANQQARLRSACRAWEA